jgi:hypothetical protein
LDEWLFDTRYHSPGYFREEAKILLFVREVQCNISSRASFLSESNGGSHRSNRRREADVQEKAAVTLVVLTAGAVLVAAAVISSTSSIRPYGERALLAQIEQQDNAFCAKFGAGAATAQFDACMRDLGDLRHDYVELLRSHWWL